MKSVAPATLERLEGTTTAIYSYKLISSQLHDHSLQDLLESEFSSPGRCCFYVPKLFQTVRHAVHKIGEGANLATLAGFNSRWQTAHSPLSIRVI